MWTSTAWRRSLAGRTRTPVRSRSVSTLWTQVLIRAGPVRTRGWSSRRSWSTASRRVLVSWWWLWCVLAAMDAVMATLPPEGADPDA